MRFDEVEQIHRLKGIAAERSLETRARQVKAPLPKLVRREQPVTTSPTRQHARPGRIPAELRNLPVKIISADLFHHMIDIGYHPRTVTVDHTGRMAELCAVATAAGYQLTHSDGKIARFEEGSKT